MDFIILKHKNTKNLLNKKFGKLTVIELFKCGGSHKHAIWRCKCECGNFTNVTSSYLISGHTKSCGCFKREKSTTHGKRKTKIYKVWCGMRSRCYNLNEPAYINYGGRGIKVCERWNKFENFYEDMGEIPQNLTLDRINNNGDYELSNCKWSTKLEQSKNRRSNINITYNGKTQCLKDWAKELNFSYCTIYRRIQKYHWNVLKAFTIPIKHYK